MNLTQAHQTGQMQMTLCLEAAERRGFDSEGARAFILSWLRRHGPMSGEDLTDAAMEHGFVPKDGRAFGGIFRSLSRDGLIRCVALCLRSKGHGTAGGRIWEAV
jgi:DNA-binding transcriptional ArsR family regulator